MAIKKSDLYSSLWASCDELRGGMDASQYKDYVLFMLFIKYISDKYGASDAFAPPVVIPKVDGGPMRVFPSNWVVTDKTLGLIPGRQIIIENADTGSLSVAANIARPG